LQVNETIISQWLSGTVLVIITLPLKFR